ncbi:hypothetical protein DSL72_001035 [Monilinia vaccinii-corymbosi]|uniref:Uncharacterized protein n=1 Tax=Monilinia vaccinii-corymbosi TaxID=61207 RepID=A0A8A3P437_9HELO|nr:hypothetical protein DSL72_001035 [Monilinia vaccinii-corymbosi]
MEEDKEVLHHVAVCVKTIALLNFIEPKILLHLTTPSIAMVYETATGALGTFDTDSVQKTILSLLPSSDEDENSMKNKADNSDYDDGAGKDNKGAKMVTDSCRHIIKSMNTIQAFKLQTDIPRQRVTIAKEIFRLIGRLETEEADQFLIQTSTNEKLLPDFYTAVLEARSHETYLSKSQTWTVYQSNASKNTKETSNPPSSLLSSPSPSSYQTPPTSKTYLISSSRSSPLLPLHQNPHRNPPTPQCNPPSPIPIPLPLPPTRISLARKTPLGGDPPGQESRCQCASKKPQRESDTYKLLASPPSSTSIIIIPRIFTLLTQGQSVTPKTRKLLVHAYLRYLDWRTFSHRFFVLRITTTTATASILEYFGVQWDQSRVA